MTKEPQNILVVGAGLAGVCVSAHLIKEGCEVTLVDNQKNHSSVVAAGLITPLVFRRMNKSWRVDEFIDYLIPFYKSWEEFSDGEILKSIPLRRMFSSEQERGYWISKQNTEEYHRYMAVVDNDDENYPNAINNFGSGRVKNCFAVSASNFFPAIKRYIAEHGTLLLEEFNYNGLDGTDYEGAHYDHVIFCEGYMVKENPWFGFLPVGQTKGEVLTVKINSIPSEESLNRKCFMLPLGDHTFRVGSTYNWDNADPTPSESGKNEILEKLSHLTHDEVEILDHKAGVRPTTMDRRPIIGTHPENINLHLFNGLGTKGYMSAPLLASEFVDYLLNGKPLNREVRIDRYLNK